MNIKPINPHAYSEGSVVAKGGSCNVTHKLIDNLKLVRCWRRTLHDTGTISTAVQLVVVALQHEHRVWVGVHDHH